MEYKINKQNRTLNFFKGVACFCVVMLHAGFPGAVGKLLYGPSRFAVPFFFMISGYYVYDENMQMLVRKIPRKIKHIAVLLVITEIVYLIWHVVQYAILGGFENVYAWFADVFSVSTILRLLLFQTTPIGDVSWFLVALLLCYIAIWFVAKQNLWKSISIFIPVLLLTNIIVGELIPFLKIDTQWYWCSNFLVLGFPFFCLGSLIKKNQHGFCEKYTTQKLVLIISLSVVCITIERVLTDASQLFIGNIFLTLALFLLCIKCPNLFKKRNFGEEVGKKHAFYVYIFHPIVRDILYGFLFENWGWNTYAIIAWMKPIVVFIVCVVVGSVICSAENKCKEIYNAHKHQIIKKVCR